MSIPVEVCRIIESVEQQQKNGYKTEPDKLGTPYTWFGGKKLISDAVWERFDEINNYIEPFLGGGAVLLGRPGGAQGHETVNDLDGQLVNFWRAVRSDAHKLADLSCDLSAEINLLANGRILYETRDLVSQLLECPKFYDSKLAAEWYHGQRLTIGPGWSLKARQGQNMPRAIRIPTVDETYRRLLTLKNRIRYVRILCGEWDRSLKSKTNLYRGGLTGVFLDPPYLPETGRATGLYHADTASNNVAVSVRRWALKHGDDPRMRIAVCGYVGEHDRFFPETWSRYRWQASGGYSNMGNAGGRERAKLECVWFSPHCIK